MNQQITVTEVVAGKFGEQVKAGKTFYSYGKFFKGDKLKVGDNVVVELYTTAKGNNYINKVVERGESAFVASAVAEVAESNIKPVAKKAFKAAADTTMSKAEWQDKDTRISRQGVIQVAVQVSGKFEDAVVLADKMLGYVHQK